MYTKYVIRLTAEECESLPRNNSQGTSERVRRAQILADADGPAWTERKIAGAFSCRTVEKVRQNEGGFERALKRKRRETPPRSSTARQKPGSSPCTRGRCRRGLVVAVAGREGGGAGDRGLYKPRNGEADAKKGFSCKRKVRYWVTPPEADAEFVARQAVETLCKTSGHPVMDEQPPIKETRMPIPADHPRRVDYEYERAGTASIFMFCEARSFRRQATARKRRMKSGPDRGGCQPAGRPLRGLREDHPGMRQPQHPHARSVLRSVRACAGTGASPANRVLLHAETWELAEHRGERTQLHDAAMPAPPSARRDSPDLGMGRRRQRTAARRGLADES